MPTTHEKEQIVVVGYGWVGQANALGLAAQEYPVSFFDITEPELRYTDEYAAQYPAIAQLKNILDKDGPNTCYIVCVGDRVSAEGAQDISAIQKALASLERARGTIVLRSTILPHYLRDLTFDYYLPEFLHERRAVEECQKPHYVIIGKNPDTDKPEPGFFRLWAQQAPKLFYGTPEEASYIKYLSNIWNALRIGFVNEFGNAIGMPTDKGNLKRTEKIINFFFESKDYLRYGKPFGGHCLPKDTRAFLRGHQELGRDMSLLAGLCAANTAHETIEKKHPILPEWFSEWSRPELSGWVAVATLGKATKKRLRSLIGLA